MFNMFTQFFRALTVLFTATEKLASAADHLATWSEEAAASLADEAREQRKQKMLALMAATRKAEADNA